MSNLGHFISFLEGNLVYPRKATLKELTKSFNYIEAYVTDIEGKVFPVPIKVKWTNKRYGTFIIFPDKTKFKKASKSYLVVG